MELTNLLTYLQGKMNEGMTKFSVEGQTYDETSGAYITKTKETYVFEDESEADAKIEEARQTFGFAGCDKKHKDAKVSKKTGEEIAPETWTVVVKINHAD